ncbi:MAG: hypothetical protein V1717_00825 [Candidatus Micrarchaeota archaeon]
MYELSVELGILFLQLLLQLAAAFFSYRIYERHRRYLPWLAITAALVLMTARRAVALFTTLGVFTEDFLTQVSLLDAFVFPLLVSSLFFYGLWSVMSEFDQAELKVEKTFKRLESRISKFRGPKI